MTSTQGPQSHGTPPPSPQPEPPFLPMHTAVVLLAAAVIGLVVGLLTVATRVPPASAALAGLTAAGFSVPILRSLIR
ncbi:hypothetical protein EF911_23275 [Streptomyces sp. WAC06128]|nr:hypothetical protein EF911_23275 [Streptomyces sp. WAC06128]